MTGSYILALDAGTTSCRSILFDHEGQIISQSQKALTQHYPQPGWVEHDANEIWRIQLQTAQTVLEQSGIPASEIAGIGITNQRETTIVWDRVTGEPVCPAIVWQCRRTAELCDAMKEQGLTDTYRNKTGLLIDAYFSATKLKWILEHVPEAGIKATRGELLFGTVDTWLIWNLTGGKVHVTDYSNASRTMMYNIHTLAWDEDILHDLGIPAGMLPEVRASSEVYGTTDPVLFGVPIPIGGAAGDQQAALFGQTCFASGEAKCTYGTGCFLLMNTGSQPVTSEHGLLTTLAASRPGQVRYALEGSIFVGGAAIQWLRDELHLISHAAESETLASQVEDANGCYVVPAFTGLGAPYWDPYARGTITGLTRGVNKNHIIRATLESIAYQVHDVLEAMEKDIASSSIPIPGKTGNVDTTRRNRLLSALRVDGGASANNLLMQFQADMIQAPVIRPACIETTAMGAAFLAGLAVGFWQDPGEISRIWKVNRTFEPAMPKPLRDEKLAGWEKAVSRARDWA